MILLSGGFTYAGIGMLLACAGGSVAVFFLLIRLATRSSLYRVEFQEFNSIQKAIYIIAFLALDLVVASISFYLIMFLAALAMMVFNAVKGYFQ